MKLPIQLEKLKELKIWLCYPLIWNEAKHNGVGGFDKPPINPFTLYNASSDDKKSLATYEEASKQIGKMARVRTKGADNLLNVKIAGVGIAFSGTGIIGLDLDNVFNKEKRTVTREAIEIIKKLNSYTEISPSGTGLHIIFQGELPDNIKKLAKQKRDIFGTEKAEYQFFDSGYMAISGDAVSNREVGERTEEAKEIYETYFKEINPIEKPSTKRPDTPSPSVVSSATGYTYERWLAEVARLSDAEILERIFASGSTGAKVRALYAGDKNGYGNDHSRADQALCTYLYGFTNDRATTERLFRSSGLYRASGKSRSYLERTLTRAATDCKKLVGHIEFTTEEKRAYAQAKAEEELRAIKFGDFLRDRARKRGN